MADRWNVKVRQEITELLGVATIGLLVSTCAMAERGQVIDRETRKPIAGAIVMAEWRGRSVNPVSSDSECYSFAIDRADVAGRYSLPSSAPDTALLLTDRSRFTTAYATGYEQPSGQTTPGVVELKKYAGSTLSRLRYLANHPFLYCVPPAQRKRVVPLLLAIYGEAHAIAKEAEELSIVARMKTNLVVLLGSEEEFQRQTGVGAGAK